MALPDVLRILETTCCEYVFATYSLDAKHMIN